MGHKLQGFIRNIMHSITHSNGLETIFRAAIHHCYYFYTHDTAQWL